MILIATLVEMPFKYTIHEFTTLKKLIFLIGRDIHINLVDSKIKAKKFVPKLSLSKNDDIDAPK